MIAHIVLKNVLHVIKQMEIAFLVSEPKEVLGLETFLVNVNVHQVFMKQEIRIVPNAIVNIVTNVTKMDLVPPVRVFKTKFIQEMYQITVNVLKDNMKKELIVENAITYYTNVIYAHQPLVQLHVLNVKDHKMLV